MNRLFAQTPDNHPDKEPLFAALAYHRDSVSRAESVKKRNEIVERVLANGDISTGSSLLSRVLKSQDSIDHNSLDDADFTGLCEIFHDDHLRLQLTAQDLEYYCEGVNTYCYNLTNFFSSLELFMRFEDGLYSEIVSKWVRFAVSFHQSLKEDLKPESYVRRHKNRDLTYSS